MNPKLRAKLHTLGTNTKKLGGRFNPNSKVRESLALKEGTRGGAEDGGTRTRYEQGGGREKGTCWAEITNGATGPTSGDRISKQVGTITSVIRRQHFRKGDVGARHADRGFTSCLAPEQPNVDTRCVKKGTANIIRHGMRATVSPMVSWKGITTRQRGREVSDR